MPDDRRPAAELRVSPFLHRVVGRITSPLTGAALEAGDPLLPVLAAQPAGSLFDHGPTLSESDFRRLVEGAFLVDDVEAASRRSRLAFASIETCSVCNHRCAFCPVSVDPRSMETMPQELFVRIVDEVAAENREVVVFLNNYNEPTVDPLFLERLEVLFSRKIPAALLTNGSRLTPDKVARIREMGRLRYLGLNLPTIDPARYKEMHGTDDLAKILAHLDHVLANPIAEENAFVVLGYDDEAHQRDVEAIGARYGSTGWAVRKFRVENRAGLVAAPLAPRPRRRLAGCELMGSRPLEHLHVVASGKVVFCCQDYYETHVVGDLRGESVREVLASDALARLRRWSYGVEEAPADFMCRNCEFALEGPEPGEPEP